MVGNSTSRVSSTLVVCGYVSGAVGCVALLAYNLPLIRSTIKQILLKRQTSITTNTNSNGGGKRNRQSNHSSSVNSSDLHEGGGDEMEVHNGSFCMMMEDEGIGGGLDDETLLMLQQHLPIDGAFHTTDPSDVASITEVPILNITLLSSTLRSEWTMAAPMLNYHINEAFEVCPSNRALPYCAVQFRCTTDVTSPLLNLIGEDMLHATLTAQAYITQRTSADSLDNRRRVKVPQLGALVAALQQCRTGDGREPDIGYIATTNTSEECGVDITTCVISLVVIRGRIAFVVQLQCRRDPTYFQRHLSTFISVAGQVAQQVLSLQPKHVTFWTRVRRMLRGGSLLAPPLSRCDRCLIAREDALCLSFTLPKVGTSEDNDVGPSTSSGGGAEITVPAGSNRYMPWSTAGGLLTAEALATLETIKEHSPDVYRLLYSLLVEKFGSSESDAPKHNVGVEVCFILNDFTGRGVTLALHLIGPEEQALFQEYAALESELAVLNPTVSDATSSEGDVKSASPVVGPAATGRVRSHSIMDAYNNEGSLRHAWKYVRGLIQATQNRRHNVTAVLEGARASELVQDLCRFQVPPAQRPSRPYFKRGQRKTECKDGSAVRCTIALNATVENVILILLAPKVPAETPSPSRSGTATTTSPPTETPTDKGLDSFPDCEEHIPQSRFSDNEIRRYMSVVSICRAPVGSVAGLHFVHGPSGVSYKLPLKLSKQSNTFFFTHLFGHFYFEWCRDYKLLALVNASDEGGGSLNGSYCHTPQSSSYGSFHQYPPPSTNTTGNCCTFRIGVTDSRQPLQQLIERVYPHASSNTVTANNHIASDFTFAIEGQHGENEHVLFSQKNGITAYFVWTYFQHIISKGFVPPTVHNPAVARKALHFNHQK